jgi:hypothetical protein
MKPISLIVAFLPLVAFSLLAWRLLELLFSAVISGRGDHLHAEIQQELSRPRRPPHELTQVRPAPVTSGGGRVSG